MTAIQKKIVINEHGGPQEVIISWAQFCELNEALGLDLDGTAQAELREAIADSRARRHEILPRSTNCETHRPPPSRQTLPPTNAR